MLLVYWVQVVVAGVCMLVDSLASSHDHGCYCGAREILVFWICFVIFLMPYLKESTPVTASVELGIVMGTVIVMVNMSANFFFFKDAAVCPAYITNNLLGGVVTLAPIPFGWLFVKLSENLRTTRGSGGWTSQVDEPGHGGPAHGHGPSPGPVSAPVSAPGPVPVSVPVSVSALLPVPSIV
jgi:hypothetical protein